MTEQEAIEAAMLIKRYCKQVSCPHCISHVDGCSLASVLPFAWSFDEEGDDGENEQG